MVENLPAAEKLQENDAAFGEFQYIHVRRPISGKMFILFQIAIPIDCSGQARIYKSINVEREKKKMPHGREVTITTYS